MNTMHRHCHPMNIKNTIENNWYRNDNEYDNRALLFARFLSSVLSSIDHISKTNIPYLYLLLYNYNDTKEQHRGGKYILYTYLFERYFHEPKKR
mmetsp:Transcript_46925/g.52300  ORF Transcript_46925/g.52300 Transcript_46925/m.52300 type:complete len:94 (-) Transcript_46925:100-381(-)